MNSLKGEEKQIRERNGKNNFLMTFSKILTNEQQF